MSISGSNNVTLARTIREREASTYVAEIKRVENIINAVSLSYKSYKNETILAHQIILSNVSEESIARAHVKQLIRYKNERRYYLALK